MIPANYLKVKPKYLQSIISKGYLPALAALTPIHTHLAVQYQMCVIAQLPHVMLLAVTLRFNAPTSLTKCV
jgi:hypothetical protein